MKKEESIPTGIYYVIPAQVFEDERLEHSETVFYALLSGLAFSSGYCFASDEYLASRMKFTDRQIRYMLEKLEGFGYIKRETIKEGMRWSRKIFITHSRPVSKDVYERKPSSGSSGTTVPDRAEAHFRIVSKENLVSESSSSSPPSSVEASEEEEEELQKRLKERPKGAKPIRSMKKWRETVLLEIRAEFNASRQAALDEQSRLSRATRHRAQALDRANESVKPSDVCVWINKVPVPYDCSDWDWKSQTGW